MIPVDQTRFHKADDNGNTVEYGNCMQAAVASILELPLDFVPNFIEQDPGPQYCHHNMMVFFRRLGFDLVGFYGKEARGFDGYYLAYGPAKRGVSHMVIEKDCKLAHDPHPSREGLIEVKGTYAIIPFNPAYFVPNSALSVLDKRQLNFAF